MWAVKVTRGLDRLSGTMWIASPSRSRQPFIAKGNGLFATSPTPPVFFSCPRRGVLAIVGARNKVLVVGVLYCRFEGGLIPGGGGEEGREKPS